MILLYLGALELVEGITLNRQVALTASTVGNIVAQYTTISASEQMPDILDAAAQIMAPNPAQNVAIVVSLISISSTGQATVSWSETLNGTARAQGQVISVPASLDVPNTTLILSEATYQYTPLIDFLQMGSKNIFASIYMVPRDSSTINLTS